jgi:hypothetical protein
MSWTDIFPVLSEELAEEFRAKARPEERDQFEEWFGVSRVLSGNRVMSEAPRHIVSATLFWKMVLGSDPDLPAPTRERLVMAKRMGLVKRFLPWESYVEPLLDYESADLIRGAGVGVSWLQMECV